MNKNEPFKDCKHNTSESTIFDGYCALYLNEDRTAGRLVKCKGCPCDDFELEVKEKDQSEKRQTKLM